MFNYTFTILVCFLAFAVQINAQNDIETAKAETTESAKIKWLTFEEAIELSKETPKKLFIDVYTSWCHWCKVMDKKTFSHPEIIKHIQENYYAIKLDGELKENIEFMDNTFKFVASGRRGYHELAAALLNGQLSYPTCVVMSEEMQRITTIPGFRDPADMQTVLKYITEEHYLKMTFAEFQKTFTSELEVIEGAQ